jgi:cobalamin biosynthetic protein CobC
MLEHGGNLTLAAAQYNIPLADWLDLSTGINPDGYPVPEIPPAIWQRLPLDDDGLIEAACAYFDCRSALPSAGSQAAIQILPKLRPPCKVAMPSLMYKEHARAWQRYGHQISTFVDLHDDIVNSADVVLLCNPNNPTAGRFLPADLLDLHSRLRNRAGWLVVDEAFMDATPEHSIAQHSHLEGLFVLRSLGKFFGLAGARVGFLLASPQWLSKAQEELGPWSLSGPSRFITKQALSDLVWQRNTRSQLAVSSQRLAALLSKYGLTPQSGTALFQYVPIKEALLRQKQLAKQGIWVRYFPEACALRFGLPTEYGWRKLEAVLKSF